MSINYLLEALMVIATFCALQANCKQCQMSTLCGKIPSEWGNIENITNGKN